MFTIINDAVFVVHGGLFHHQDVLLEDLQQINRSDFTLLDMPQGGDGIEPMPRSGLLTIRHFKLMARNSCITGLKFIYIQTYIKT